ncbi:HaaA family cyclophane-containing RiPP peptide [Streptomyces vastus]|uniref:Uncharacterized protein n=1 Tax=Streptomyces vastus TaxID=285451 RepID=A0ABN3RNI1_9ACTN
MADFAVSRYVAALLRCGFALRLNYREPVLRHVDHEERRMPSRTPVPASQVMGHTSPVSSETAPTTAVLDRVAARVQQRLAAEQTAARRTGDGSHSASLIWPWPL